MIFEYSISYHRVFLLPRGEVNFIKKLQKPIRTYNYDAPGASTGAGPFADKQCERPFVEKPQQGRNINQFCVPASPLEETDHLYGVYTCSKWATCFVHVLVHAVGGQVVRKLCPKSSRTTNISTSRQHIVGDCRATMRAFKICLRVFNPINGF